jgi:hypothetical protein
VLFFTQDTPSVVLAWKQATVKAIYPKYYKNSNESHTFTDWVNWADLADLAVWPVQKIYAVFCFWRFFSTFLWPKQMQN